MVNTTRLKRQSISNVTCHDDKFGHHSQKKNLLTIYQQNICGLSNKMNLLIPFLHPDFLDVLCLTENELKQAQLELDNFYLGAGYCRQDLKKVGVSIFHSW